MLKAEIDRLNRMRDELKDKPRKLNLTKKDIEKIDEINRQLDEILNNTRCTGWAFG